MKNYFLDCFELHNLGKEGKLARKFSLPKLDEYGQTHNLKHDSLVNIGKAVI